ncbi:hypothetical protein KM043_003406 [Ampulex compressa]|nr:hypothetical protein KM043_003406 [Ampulex compressa]
MLGRKLVVVSIIFDEDTAVESSNVWYEAHGGIEPTIPGFLHESPSGLFQDLLIVSPIEELSAGWAQATRSAVAARKRAADRSGVTDNLTPGLNDNLSLTTVSNRASFCGASTPCPLEISHNATLAQEGTPGKERVPQVKP